MPLWNCQSKTYAQYPTYNCPPIHVIEAYSINFVLYCINYKNLLTKVKIFLSITILPIYFLIHVYNKEKIFPSFKNEYWMWHKPKACRYTLLHLFKIFVRLSIHLSAFNSPSPLLPSQSGAPFPFFPFLPFFFTFFPSLSLLPFPLSLSLSLLSLHLLPSLYLHLPIPPNKDITMVIQQWREIVNTGAKWQSILQLDI